MRGTPKTFQGFTDGVNLVDPPYSLTDRQARDALNVYATGRGGVAKRNGNALFASLAGLEAQGLFAGSSPATLIAQTGSTVRAINTGGTEVTTASSTNLVDWVQAPISGTQGPYYGVTGTTSPLFYSGTAFGVWTVSTGTMPAGSYIEYVGNRVIIAGDPNNPSRVYGSKIGDPRIFASPDGWAVDFDASDGLPITALGTVGPYVLVFKEHKVWVIYDTDTGANRRITDSAGCLSNRSVVETPEGTFYLSRDGVYKTDGQRVTRVSDRIRPLIDRLVAANTFRAAGAYYNRHYYLAISTTGSRNNVVLDYDLELDSWWLQSCAVNQFAVWRQTSGTQLYGAAVTSGIDTMFVSGLTQDRGANFTSYWSGPFHVFGEPYRRKRVRQIHFDGKGVMDLRIARDFNVNYDYASSLSFSTGASSTLFGGADNFGGVGTFGDVAAGTGGKTVEETRALTPNPGVARAWSLQFGQFTGSADPWECESYTFALTPRRN